jgi:hypothetical protein
VKISSNFLHYLSLKIIFPKSGILVIDAQFFSQGFPNNSDILQIYSISLFPLNKGMPSKSSA